MTPFTIEQNIQRIADYLERIAERLAIAGVPTVEVPAPEPEVPISEPTPQPTTPPTSKELQAALKVAVEAIGREAVVDIIDKTAGGKAVAKMTPEERQAVMVALP